jgi:hypothetical protein
VGIDRVGALRLRHAAAQARFVVPPLDASVSGRSIPLYLFRERMLHP